MKKVAKDVTSPEWGFKPREGGVGPLFVEPTEGARSTRRRRKEEIVRDVTREETTTTCEGIEGRLEWRWVGKAKIGRFVPAGPTRATQSKHNHLT